MSNHTKAKNNYLLNYEFHSICIAKDNYNFFSWANYVFYENWWRFFRRVKYGFITQFAPLAINDSNVLTIEKSVAFPNELTMKNVKWNIESEFTAKNFSKKIGFSWKASEIFLCSSIVDRFRFDLIINFAQSKISHIFFKSFWNFTFAHHFLEQLN